MNVLNSHFEAEVFPHLSLLTKVALRLKGNQMDAEDLVQETLLRALRFWDQFTPGTNCKAWLLRILNNQHINEWRVTSRRAVSVDIATISEVDLGCLMQEPDWISYPDQKIISQMLNDELYTAICRLKDDYRRIMLMYSFRDMPYQQIARLTHLRLGTVKSRLFRSRQLLRESLNEYAINNGYVTQNSN